MGIPVPTIRARAHCRRFWRQVKASACLWIRPVPPGLESRITSRFTRTAPCQWNRPGLHFIGRNPWAEAYSFSFNPILSFRLWRAIGAAGVCCTLLLTLSMLELVSRIHPQSCPVQLCAVQNRVALSVHAVAHQNQL